MSLFNVVLKCQPLPYFSFTWPGDDITADNATDAGVAAIDLMLSEWESNSLPKPRKRDVLVVEVAPA